MFWRQSSVSSAIEELLSGSNPSLTDVLEEDSVVQEAKVSNPKLVAYLQQAEVVQELVRMIVDARAGDGESHASTACELLCCDVDGMLTTLLSHKQGELFYTLLSFLSKCESESCLDERMAGRFTHAVSSVFARRSGEVVELLRYVSDLVGMFMRTLGNASVTDLLTRLVCADECIALDVEDARHVFASKGLAAELKDRLSSNCNEHVRMNASEVLCAITRSTHSPLSRELATEPIISSLASLALPCSDPTQGSLQALEVLVAQLDPQQSSAGPTLTMQSPYEGNLFGNDDDDVEDPFRPFREVVIETASRAPELEYVLRTAPSEVEVANSSAAAQPVGPRRLKVAEGVASLIKAREPSAAEKLQQAGVMSALIDLSFSCPYNSMAHHALERAVCSALDWEASDLAHHVVFDCKLPHRLASVQRFWQMANGRRARSGFMGHIVRMSDKLEDVLGDELLSNDEWQAFADGELSDVRDASNTSAWDCGRPPGVDDMLMEAFNQVNTTDNAHGYSLPSYAAAGFAPLGESVPELTGESLAAKAFANDTPHDGTAADKEVFIGDDDAFADDAFFDTQPARPFENEDEVLHLSDSDDDDDDEAEEDAKDDFHHKSDWNTENTTARRENTLPQQCEPEARTDQSSRSGAGASARVRPPTPSPGKSQAQAAADPSASLALQFTSFQYWRVNPFEVEDESGER